MNHLCSSSQSKVEAEKRGVHYTNSIQYLCMGLSQTVTITALTHTKVFKFLRVAQLQLSHPQLGYASLIDSRPGELHYNCFFHTKGDTVVLAKV